MLKSVLMIWLSACLFLQAACSQSSGSPALVSGTIRLSPGWKPVLYLVKPAHYRQLISPYEGVVLDSAQIGSDGRFEFQNRAGINEKEVYLIEIQQVKSKYKNEILSRPDLENYICVVLEPGKTLRLRADAAALSRSYRLENPDADNRLIAGFRDARTPFFDEFDALIAKTSADSLQQWSTHGSHEVQQKVNAAIDSLMETALSPYPIFVGMRLRSPDNEFFNQPEKAVQLYERLQNLAPAHPWTPELGFYLKHENLPVLKGEKMPDFALPTPRGDTLRLDSVRSALLLVDFWASWCAPCRTEIRNTIVPLYAQYHDKGFNVVGISIDQDRKAWTAAIQKDGALWPQLSDLMGDESPVRSSLRFRYIPANYLLDASGVLLARNVHGDTLRQMVADYLNKK